MIRWLDFNDTWLAAEWGHPSDNLGGILAVADWLSRTAVAGGLPPLTMRAVLTAMIKAHEIQGCLALENAFNKVGLDHVVLVKVATTAVVAQMLGLNHGQILDALSLAWVDGQSLRTYRHAPNTGSRKSWAAGDATSRGVRLALMVRAGEMGYPSVLTAKVWGFYDVLFRGQPFKFQRPYGSYVMENVLFKISYPAEFHAQTAVEAAMTLRAKLVAAGKSAQDIVSAQLRTHEACLRIIDKKGPLNNPADRDHCVQYMMAVPLIFGHLTASDYEDSFAADPAYRCTQGEDALHRRARFHARIITIRRSVPSPIHLPFCWPMAARSAKRLSILSAIAAAESKAFRCWKKSFASTWAGGSRRNGSRRSWRPRLISRHSNACPVHEYVDLYAV